MQKDSGSIPPNSDQTPQQATSTDEHKVRNFRLTLANGIFANVGFRFLDSSTVLSAFVKKLTGSNILVGLISSTMSAGWMWPQLLMSNLLEHRPQKMPFYTLGVVIRTIAWMLIPLLTLLIGNKNHLLLFACFYLLYFAASSSLGISSIPFSDIIAKSIPAEKRTRLFGLRQFGGEVLGIGVGLLIRYILSEKFYLSFPYNYATIFTLGMLTLTISCVSFIFIKEPIHPVLDARRPLWQHLKRGPDFLKADPDYRYYTVFRITSSFGSMCVPFYVPYALDRIGVHVSSIGSFTAAGAVSAVFSNIIWGQVGEKYGSRSLMVIASSLACIAPLIAISVTILPSSSQAGFYLLVFIVNQAFLSGIGIANMTYILEVAPSMSRPTYLGFLNTLMFPISFVPVLAGVLLKIMPYEFMFVLSAGMSALSVYLARNLLSVENEA